MLGLSLRHVCKPLKRNWTAPYVRHHLNSKMILSSLPTKFKVLRVWCEDLQKQFSIREKVLWPKVWTSSLSRLRSLRFSVQSFISYLASKELPEEMQLVYNSSQPSCETSGKTIVPVVSFKFKLEKLRAFSVCCGYYFKLLRMACQWSRHHLYSKCLHVQLCIPV